MAATAWACASIVPQKPHIFAAGYGAAVAFPAEHGGPPLVKKPYSVESLREMVVA